MDNSKPYLEKSLCSLFSDARLSDVDILSLYRIPQIFGGRCITFDCFNRMIGENEISERWRRFDKRRCGGSGLIDNEKFCFACPFFYPGKSKGAWEAWRSFMADPSVCLASSTLDGQGEVYDVLLGRGKHGCFFVPRAMNLVLFPKIWVIGDHDDYVKFIETWGLHPFLAQYVFLKDFDDMGDSLLSELGTEGDHRKLVYISSHWRAASLSDDDLNSIWRIFSSIADGGLVRIKSSRDYLEFIKQDPVIRHYIDVGAGVQEADREWLEYHVPIEDVVEKGGSFIQEDGPLHRRMLYRLEKEEDDNVRKYLSTVGLPSCRPRASRPTQIIIDDLEPPTAEELEKGFEKLADDVAEKWDPEAPEDLTPDVEDEVFNSPDAWYDKLVSDINNLAVTLQRHINRMEMITKNLCAPRIVSPIRTTEAKHNFTQVWKEPFVYTSSGKIPISELVDMINRGRNTALNFFRTELNECSGETLRAKLTQAFSVMNLLLEYFSRYERARAEAREESSCNLFSRMVRRFKTAFKRNRLDEQRAEGAEYEE